MGYCKYCDVKRVNMSVHDMSIKHMKLFQLHEYIDNILDENEKQHIFKLIDSIQTIKNKEKSDKNKDYRKQYYKDHIKGKYTRIREEEQNSCYLTSKTEIIRDDGMIEYQEVWIERDSRFNTKKNKSK